MLRIAVSIIVLMVVCALGLARAQACVQDNENADARTIVAGENETITMIAERLGVSAAELSKLNHVKEHVRLPKGTKVIVPTEKSNSEQPQVVGQTITLADGYSFQADEVWRSGDEIWYRKGNVTSHLKDNVKSIRPITKPKPPESAPATPAVAPTVAASPVVWISLVGGARFRVDEVQQTNDGAWYTRDKITIFLAKERIASIERELPAIQGVPARIRDWTSGNRAIDDLIKSNGSRFGVDPYLVFLVIEQESHFHVSAVSPKGARGLMQLMPGTARRYGVSKPFEAAQNIKGGTQYLRELMELFEGDVNLVLASYNAGEGAVIKFGRSVPPYRETRDYVRSISKRYGLSGRQVNSDNDVPAPQR
ncbi:MAG: hypothetical protein C5B55_03540 [Blastocatellia bacterium]|nr:MAG: hypothetical protein C5B55_03540 [Blastocatellia bacterium]